MDKKLEDALRTAVRRSLQEMSRALNGDKRLEVAPLFIVSLHLDDTKRIELRPTVQVSLSSDLDTSAPNLLPPEDNLLVHADHVKAAWPLVDRCGTSGALL